MSRKMPSNEDYQRISEWLDEYHSTADALKKEELKNIIVLQMIPVVKKIAKTIARRATDPIEDMVQAGCIGVLKAIDNYSKEKNDNFRVYAGYLIIGEMKHYLRDKLSTIRVPRHIQELSIRIYNFTKTLTTEEVQSLTSDDVASALDVSTKSVDIALQVERRRSTLSLDELFKVEEGSLKYDELLAQKNYNEKSEYEDARIIFDEVIDKLPPDERVLIDMYYKQDMSKKEIAEALLISQMALSRKMKKAFNLMSEIIAKKKREQEELDQG